MLPQLVSFPSNFQTSVLLHAVRGFILIPFTIRNLPLTFMDHSSEAEEISMTMAHLNHKLVLDQCEQHGQGEQA